MPGRLILTASAIVLGVFGAVALFAPDELSPIFGAPSTALSTAIQLIGSGFLGFAGLNWMSRGNRIGGIYARPLGIGNLMLFTTAALTVGRAATTGQIPSASLGLCAVLGLLAASFAWLVFLHDPLSEPQD